MKVNIYDAHDRLKHFGRKEHADYISQGCADCIKNRPEEFGNHSFYIFAHCRTADDGSTKRLIWSPRLTKPKAQTNSMLFKAYPPGDTIKVLWMIPAREMWPQYKKGQMLSNQIVWESIHKFENDRGFLEAKEEDDLSDDVINNIFLQISQNARYRKRMDMMYLNGKDD